MERVRSGDELKRVLDARDRARDLRQTMTPAEQALWTAVRGSRLEGLKFRRQAPLDCFVLDFYCQSLKLIVELDGGIHTEPHQVAHDENRDAHLRSLGCTILRFPNAAVLHDLPTVLEKISQTARVLTPRS
ncbi:MAG TPA: DUF559 domain-containing protein [Thermoanaerobaculia bacterium]|nr:DUF559 domain-containing protein [Thermoanaerobaculia bacterium]